MGFFDLNIPYTESDKHITNKSTRKATRLKLTVKSMELGYSGIAYNHTIKGVMSESDRCSISLFPLSSILKLSPSLSSTLKLHRELLKIPLSTPFRQYTRLTVIVDSSSQASALNSGNPILKSYDIVAVRPLNQNAFEQACQASEVDLIAIDFSGKLPFRLKQPMVKAAIERGVHFEITYSSLLIDAQVRRQTITNAKLLVDWTRGKNLIFSSSAPSVTELRGPYDIANLLSLLGISMERAKSAISKTCRSLLANALRKKQFFKEAIRVEVISSTEQLGLKGSGFDDWLKWDPISSGEGDLQLDDMAKFFSASSKSSKTVKAIDFTSIIDGLPSHDLHIKDFCSGMKVTSEPQDIGRDLSAAAETEKPLAVYGLPVESDSLNLPDKDQILLIDTPQKDQTLLIDIPERDQTLSFEDSKMSLASDLEASASSEEAENHSAMIVEETKRSNDPDENHTAMIVEEVKRLNNSDLYFSCPETDLQNLGVQVHETISEACAILSEENAGVQAVVSDTEIASACNAVSAEGISTPFEDILPSALQGEGCKNLYMDEPLGPPIVAVNKEFVEIDIRGKGNSSLLSSDASLDERIPEGEQLRETGDNSIAPTDALPILESYDEMQNKCANAVCIHEPLQDAAMEDQLKIDDHTGGNYLSLPESSSEGVRGRQRNPHRSRLFPFKRLLHSVPFKKKAQKLRNRSMIASISKLSG